LNLFEQPYAIYRHDRLSLDSGIGRTALDRIDYGPGVIIQHTAPGQTSPYIRGLTGKQSLLEGQKGDTHVFLLLPPRTPRSS
jgi:hypothetical protein